MDKEHTMLEARILQGQGKTQLEIAEILGVCERTVRNHLKGIPVGRKKPHRGSKVDGFKAKIDEILEDNAFYNGELIYERLVKMGYSGKISVEMFRRSIVCTRLPLRSYIMAARVPSG